VTGVASDRNAHTSTITQQTQKTLKNIKPDSVIGDILDVSGRRRIEAIIAGVRNPSRLAELADRRNKASPTALYDPLHGRHTAHHRFMLRNGCRSVP
jgi:transposase